MIGVTQVAQIIRYDYDPDDRIGGASPTGTVLYNNLYVRISSIEPSMVLLEQGAETLKMFRAVLDNEALHVSENDEMIVINPPDSMYLNQRFRIVAVQNSSLRAGDPRSKIVVTMRRWEKAHGRQP